MKTATKKKRAQGNLKWFVTMSSFEFGTEDFAYDSLEEAVAGFNRLVKNCSKQFSEDGIERELKLIGASVCIDHDLPREPLRLR